MKIDIDNLSEDELIELNNRIIERLKFIQSYHDHQEMMRFNIGEQVTFEPPGRGRQVGILVKYNKKSVTVVTESGQKWTVSPHFLSKVKPVKENKSSGKNNVVKLNKNRS